MIAWEMFYFHLETSSYRPLNGVEELAALDSLPRKRMGMQVVHRGNAPVPGVREGGLAEGQYLELGWPFTGALMIGGGCPGAQRQFPPASSIPSWESESELERAERDREKCGNVF